jgi:hypothetical protein
MFAKKTITRIAVIATLGLAVLAGTAATAMADDGGSASFGNAGNWGSVSVSPINCYQGTHLANFNVYVMQPPAYANGISFSDIVYSRDLSVSNSPWVNRGQVTYNLKTVSGSGDGSINQLKLFSSYSGYGIPGHNYQFRLYFNWGPIGGYWQGWKYFDLGPFTWIFSNGQSIRGYGYCRL